MSPTIKYLPEITATILAEHSKKNTIHIVEWVGKDKLKMAALMHCFFSKDIRICQRASWPLTFIGQKKPQLFKPYTKKMVDLLDNPLHNAVARNTLRIFEDCEIPEAVEGQLLEKCFEYINNPKEATAIRAFAITVGAKIVRKYPDLKHEFVSTLEDFLPYGKASFKYRARKFIKELS